MKNKVFMSLKSRITLYTAIPVIIVIILTGILMTVSIRNMIDNISRSDAAGATALAGKSIEAILNDYGLIAYDKADSENIRRFLQTADDRDEMDKNAYFSLAMGELDSTISDNTELIDRVWIASSGAEGVAFSNSSSGWTAAADFKANLLPYYSKAADTKSYYITNQYLSDISGEYTITFAAPIRDSRTNAVLGIFGLDVSSAKLRSKISELPEAVNTNLIIVADRTIIYHYDSSYVGRSFADLKLEENTSNLSTDIVRSFNVNGSEMVGVATSTPNSAWDIYSLRSYDETIRLKNIYTQMTAAIFCTVIIIMSITLISSSNKIAQPIQQYTKLINEIDFSNISSMQKYSKFLKPQGCSELEALALSFNDLLNRNAEMLTQLQEMHIKSEKERILYQTALQSASDVVFEYDIADDVIITYGSLLDPSLPKTEAISREKFLHTIINSHECTSEKDKATRFFAGSTKDELIFSAKCSDNNVHWFELEGTGVFNNDTAVKIVGKIRCVDDMMNLKEDAQRDMFSGFYNKAATEQIIRERLAKPQKNAALIIIDIDNFKTINDILGHEFGDFVIKDIADKISRIITPETVAGRIGGDEFMLFVPECSADKEFFAGLCSAIKHTYGENNGTVDISASVGISYYSDGCQSFEELYRTADIAMYISKSEGKNRFTVYSGQSRPEYMGRRY